MKQDEINGTRQPWIDVLRGIAIICMVPANLSPYFSEPHPVWFRIMGSYAAPLFISLSAAMILLRADHHTLQYYLKRGMVVLGCGVLLDLLLWQILPGTSFDVLYIIGPGMLVAYLLRMRSPMFLFGATAAFFLTAVLLQVVVGYNGVVCEIYLNDIGFPGVTRILQSWFVDGWFPIFPWVGFSMFGLAFFRYLFFPQQAPLRRFILWFGLLCATIGFVTLLTPIGGVTNLANDGIIASREGYSEIFYAPGLPYLISAIGVIILLSLLIRRRGSHNALSIIALFGRYSMLVYILHQVMGVTVVSRLPSFWNAELIDSGPVFTGATIGVLVVIAGICLLFDQLKKRYRPRNVVLQVLIGK